MDLLDNVQDAGDLSNKDIREENLSDAAIVIYNEKGNKNYEKTNHHGSKFHEYYDNDLTIGMTVDSEEKAYNLYCEHARRLGFNVRKGNTRYDTRSGVKVIRKRDFLCSNEGVYTNFDLFGQKRTNRLVKRTGCKAFIRFTVNDGVWEVTHLNKEHNHEFVAPEDKQYLKINRTIDQSDKSIITSMVGAGIGATQAYSYIKEEKGGGTHIGYTKRDFQNFVQRSKMELIERGDAQSVLSHFKKCQMDDQMFFHSELLDEEGRLAHFFWRDGKSKIDYDCFGDVVIFDTTYRTNRYNMIFAPFVGINHHRKNIFFACAFLSCENTETFTWVFETFLQAMGDRAPQVIFTYQCQAMANAIEIVFPKTCHRLFSWHISKNAAQRLGSLFSNPEFRGMFFKCLYDCDTVVEFELTWNEMVKKFDLAKISWLKTIYELKEKWCPAFSLVVFTARLRSTQRSESMNNVLHKFTSKTMSLTQFVHEYERQCENMRSNEKEEDFRCKHGRPQIRLEGSKILKQAADLYTTNIYFLFESEFLSSLTVHLKQVSYDGTLHIYSLSDELYNKNHLVEFSPSSCCVKCSCKMLESNGWLCRHALKVLNEWNITKLPDDYILTRWTKSAKKGRNIVDQTSHDTTISSLTIRRNILLQQAYQAINLLVVSDEGAMVAKKRIDELWEEAKKFSDVCDLNKKKCLSGPNFFYNDVTVKDPKRVREKGVTNARMRSCLEKKRRKKNKECKFSQRQSVSTVNESLQNHPFGIAMHANIHDESNSHNDVSVAHSSALNEQRQVLDNNFSYTSMLQDNYNVSPLIEELGKVVTTNYINEQ